MKLVPIVLLIAGAAAAESGLRWPLSLKRALSSTFAETRSTAFHAGIDLKTWGKTGYDVHALADGFALRLRTSPWGYGRAIYQQLTDGRIVVYAHLESFADPLAALVKTAQQEKGQYTVDIWLKEGEAPIRQGDVLAQTGDSGAGPPHLHLELRDANNVPINPLTNGLGVEDRTPPTIQRIALIPVDINSGVNGGHAPYPVSVRVKKKGGNLFEAVEPVSVHGRIAVAVKAYDRAEGAYNKLAPYRHELVVGGAPILTAIYDRVSYSEAHQVSLDRWRLESDEGERQEEYFNLFRLSGNRLDFYETQPQSNGIIACQTSGARAEVPGDTQIPKGDQMIEVVSADVAGNESRARVLLRVNQPPQVRSLRLVEGGDVSLYVEADLTDVDDRELEVELSNSPDGRRWKRDRVQRVRAGAGPFTWALPADANRLWRLRVDDGVGPAALRTFAVVSSDSGAGQELTLSLRRIVYDDFVDLHIATNRILDAPPEVRVLSARSPNQSVTLKTKQTESKEYVTTVPLNLFGTDRTASQRSPVNGRTVWQWALGFLGHAERAAKDDLTGLSAASGVIKIAVRASSAGHAMSKEIELSAALVDPGRKSRLIFGKGEMALDFQRDSLYGPFFPQGERISPEGTQWLRSTGVGYDIGPRRTAFERPVGVSLRAPPGFDGSKLAVYGRHNGKWAFAGNEISDMAGFVGASVRRLGRFALFADEWPPTIEALRPASGSVIETGSPELSAAVVDSGSGIGREEDVALILDGSRMISVYDPEANRVTFVPEKALEPGEHELIVTARDNCGNEATRLSKFRIR